MRPGFAHRRNSAFVRSSGLGEIQTSPVIKEVSIQRGNGAKKTIVKEGKIFVQRFNFRRGDKLTFEADLLGTGYFYATFDRGGKQNLLFALPINNRPDPTDPGEFLNRDRRFSHTLILRERLEGLNFHISATVPTNLNTAYLDDTSRIILKNTPSAYSALGFMPTEPEVSLFTGSTSSATALSKAFKATVFDSDSKARIEADLQKYLSRENQWDSWPGTITTHDWDYGRSGTQVTRGEDVKWYANYDGGWLGAASVYKFLPEKGWQVVGQANQYLQVGQPHCIVGQLVGYKDTTGLGGEYHYYTGNGRYSTNTTWQYADRMSGSKIRLMDHSYIREIAEKDHGSRANRVNFDIQDYYALDNGGEVTRSFEAGYWIPTPDHPDGINGDTFCAKVEWWNPDSGAWSKPAVHPPWTAKISSKGKFAFYFRFPRQLSKEDPFYEKTPQWKIDGEGGTMTSYPYWHKGTRTAHYSRIGRPPVAGTQDEGLSVEIDGVPMTTCKETTMYQIAIAPESKSDDGNKDAHDNQKKSYIVMDNCNLQAVDPHAYSYSANPDILKAYWKGGNFKPGGSFMLMGQAADFFQGFWVSTDSLAGKGNTPMDLQNQQYDFVRGEKEPNSYSADQITNYRRFKVTDIDDPRKVANFQASWDACFPGVPFTKQILTAIIRGDQLPELEGVNYEKLPGFIDDDPLRYEVDYEGEKYRHPYSLVYCEIPEGWWGPTVSKDAGVNSVYIGGQNWYYYIFEEKTDLRQEIEYQVQLEEAGLTAAEQFAASELENEMTDITFEAYKNRNETVKEAVNLDKKEDISWWLRTEQVKFRHKKVSLLGSVGSVTDVTDRYSADHITSLDGLSKNNTRQYGFNELFVVEGIGNSPSIVITPPKEPESSGPPLKPSNVSGFGNSERQALKARALGGGNPMKFSTEAKLDSLQIAPMGTVLDTALGLDDGAILDTVTTGMYLVGGLVALGAIIKLKPLFDNIATAKALKETARNRKAESELDLITSAKKAKRA